MADDKPKDGQAGRASRNRRRPPTTIDLQATEIAAPEPTQPAPADDVPPAAVEPLTPEPIVQPEPEPPFIQVEPASDGGAPPPPRGGFRSVLGGSVAGGAVAVIVLLIAWSVWGGADRDTALHQQAVRIGDVETALHDLATRKPPTAVDAATIDALSQRVAKVESAPGAPASAAADPALATRLAALEKTIGSLNDEVAKLNQRSDKTAATVDAVRQRAETVATTAETAQSNREQGAATVRQDVDSLSNRLGALERNTQAVRTELAQQQTSLAKQAASADERVLRLAVAAEALKQAVTRGERFRAELDAAKTLAPNAATLAPLETFASSGVPTAGSLGRELGATLPAMRRLVAPPASQNEGFLQRLQVNAERLVRIRPIDETVGEDPDSVLGRLEVRATHGNIGGALAELDKLPPAVRAPAEPWIKKARARDAALDASERFAALAIGALAQPSK